MLLSCCFYKLNKVFSIFLLIFNFIHLTKFNNRTLMIKQVFVAFLYLILITYVININSFEYFNNLFIKLFEFDLREKISNYFFNIHSNQVASFLSLLILNIKNNENYDLYNSLVNLSIVHLIVIGGFHVNLICFIFKKIFIKQKKFANILSCIVSLFFCLLTNFSASITRTFVSYIFSLSSKTKKYNNELSILTFCLISPQMVLNIGLCMSFACIRGLNIFSKLKIKNIFLKSIFSSFFVSIYLLPLLSHISAKFTIWSFLFSFLLSPIFSISYYFILIFC